MAVASGSGRRVSAKKPAPIDSTPTRPRTKWPKGRRVRKASASRRCQISMAKTGSRAKKERKNTICPAGMVAVALSRVAITTKAPTESTLRAMPRRGW